MRKKGCSFCSCHPPYRRYNCSLTLTHTTLPYVCPPPLSPSMQATPLHSFTPPSLYLLIPSFLPSSPPSLWSSGSTIRHHFSFSFITLLKFSPFRSDLQALRDGARGFKSPFVATLEVLRLGDETKCEAGKVGEGGKQEREWNGCWMLGG